MVEIVDNYLFRGGILEGETPTEKKGKLERAVGKLAFVGQNNPEFLAEGVSNSGTYAFGRIRKGEESESYYIELSYDGKKRREDISVEDLSFLAVMKDSV